MREESHLSAAAQRPGNASVTPEDCARSRLDVHIAADGVPQGHIQHLQAA